MRTTMVATVAVGVLALMGCTGEASEEADGSTSTALGSESSATAPTDVHSSSDPSEVNPGDSSSGPALGTTFEYDDGLVVSVSPPEVFMPSKTARMGPEPDYISLTVTVVNGTELELSPLDVTVTVSSGGGQGGDVLDPDSGLGAPEKAIAPGEKADWELAFGVLDGEEVAVNVQPGVDRSAVIFGD